MRRLERIELIDRIGRELQTRMSYSDIDVYLKACDVNTKKETSGVNSKWVYVKELLADEPEHKILEIAEELEIEHGYAPRRDSGSADTKFWTPGYLRLFISHVSAIKGRAAQLQKVLKKYGISGFVAHEDIEPTKEWQSEIEKSLMSMDALIAILSPGFKESNWTDQEVGVAVGRDVLVIPVRKGLDPYGFIAKYQGYQGESRTLGEVAQAIFQILSANPKTKGRLADVLVTLLLSAKTLEEVRHWLGLLQSVDGLPERHAERVQANAPDSQLIMENDDLRAAINRFLKSHDLEGIEVKPPAEAELDDDIPF